MEAWWRHAGGQPAQEREWIHVNCDRPIGVGLLQGDADEAIGLPLHSLLRNRRSAQPGLYSVPKSFSDVSAKAWHSAKERPPRICAASECR